MGQQFRAGVVIVIRHPDRQEVMAFERADFHGQWQFPQGGLKDGEEPVAAAWRELAEETGLGPSDVELVEEHPGWIAYEWPPEIRDKRRGQVQRWFAFTALSPDVAPIVDERELRAWRWCTREWLIDQVVDFRRDAYRTALASL